MPHSTYFCWKYVECGDNGTEAYTKIYGPSSGAPQAASRLLRRPDVQTRLAEIQSEAAGRAEITIDSLIEKYEYVYEQAKDDPRGYAAAINAQNSIARITGNWKERVEVTVENMSDAELAEAIKGEQAGSVIPWDKVLKASRGS